MVGTFTVLERADGGRGRKRRGGQPELERVPVPGGTFFYVLRAPRRSDPEKLFRLAQRCTPCVLTTLPIPPDKAGRRFTPRAFPLRRAAAAMCAILPMMRLPPQTLALGVLDPDGALCGRTDVLLPLAADVRIVTNRPQQFARDVVFARRQFGAGVTVGEDAGLLCGCDAVVCGEPDEAFADVPVVLSCRPADGAYSLLPPKLPEEYARLCPASIPHELFAAALAEKCGVRSPALYACTGVDFDGVQTDDTQTAALWRQRIVDRRKIFS